MKIGLRTLLVAVGATAFTSCDRGHITAPPPPQELNAISPGSSISVRESSCTTPTASFTLPAAPATTTVCARLSFVVVNDGGDTNVWVRWLRPGGAQASQVYYPYEDGQAGPKVVDEFLNLSATSATGTWTVLLCPTSGCNTTAALASATFTVTAPGPAAQNITFPYPGDKVWGDEAFGLAATASSALSVSYASQTESVCQVSGSTVTIQSVGTCTIRAAQAGDGTTWGAAPTVDVQIPVAQRSITVSADPQQKYVGEADPQLTYQITSGELVGGDALSGSLERVSGENPGAYAVQQGTLSAGPNYGITYVGANLTILVVPVSWTFDGFFLPVQMGQVTPFAAGAAIPLGFRIFVDGVQKTTTEGITFSLVSVDCESFEPIGEPTQPESPTALRYAGGAGGGAFLFVWRTPREAGCYRFTMSVGDAPLTADFRLW